MRTICRLVLTLALATCFTSPLFAQIEGQIGNLNDPVLPGVPNILFGDQSIAYLVFPDEQVSCPDGGFELQSVQMYLEFTPNQVPATIVVAGGLLEAIPEGGEYRPGPELCLSAPYTITIEEPGVHLIQALEPGCGVLPVDQPYFLTMQFLGDAVANLVIDDQPAPGIEFLYDGNLWIDMNTLDRTSGGKVIVWGDLICSPVVQNEARSWRDIRALFR